MKGEEILSTFMKEGESLTTFMKGREILTTFIMKIVCIDLVTKRILISVELSNSVAR